MLNAHAAHIPFHGAAETSFGVVINGELADYGPARFWRIGEVSVAAVKGLLGFVVEIETATEFILLEIRRVEDMGAGAD